ncbi:uncharacterized protein LOC127814187 isoform X2 [Diospyros lotus]|uniref:uncharacterized protein LOC127814187 isoform X2 n=1 Tax=Diospyros lotus TaxID=55363 RepID=UPI0022583847|nr:uncharacterized protein LOC127814187 isoform X2 [Diospyros lotus]
MSLVGLREYVRNPRRRKVALDLDLNMEPAGNPDQEGNSGHTNSQNVQAGQQGGSVLPLPIDVDSFDDDVVISSARAFAEAKNNSRRNRQNTLVVDLDSEEREVGTSNRNKRRRVSSSQIIINCDLYKNKNVESMEPSSLPPPPPKEPTFSCPVCMGQFVEEMSTKCGHIFCKSCLKSAIAAQGKCPTCRRKVTMKDTIRVYLPAAN